MTALDQILLLEVSESYDMETWNTILETLVAAMLKTEKLANMVHYDSYIICIIILHGALICN